MGFVRNYWRRRPKEFNAIQLGIILHADRSDYYFHKDPI